MTSPSSSSPAATDERRETPRIRLARVASAAALRQGGVTGLDSGLAGRNATFSGTTRLPGVVVVADDGAGDAADGRYGVALYLTAAPTDLHELAGQVLGAVREAARTDGLGDALGEVHITFTDLTLPDGTPDA